MKVAITKGSIVVDDEAFKKKQGRCFGVLFNEETAPDQRQIWVAGSMIWTYGKDYRGEIIQAIAVPEGMTADQQESWTYAIELCTTVLRHGRKFESQYFDWSKYLFT